MKYLIILAIIVLGWCPWLKPEEALQIVDARVAKMQAENPDLCAMYIYRETLKKVPFGYTEEVSYDCTATDAVFGIPKAHNTVFVSFYKGLLGMPNKSVEKAPG